MCMNVQAPYLYIQDAVVDVEAEENVPPPSPLQSRDPAAPPTLVTGLTSTGSPVVSPPIHVKTNDPRARRPFQAPRPAASGENVFAGFAKGGAATGGKAAATHLTSGGKRALTQSSKLNKFVYGK